MVIGDAGLFDRPMALGPTRTDSRPRVLTTASTPPRPATPSYAAPEVCEGGPLSQRTDQWMPGMTALHLLTGGVRSAGPDELLRHDDTERRSLEWEPGAELGGPAASVLATAMDADPYRRFTSCSGLVSALAEPLGGSELRAAEHTLPPQGPPGRGLANTYRSHEHLTEESSNGH